MPAFHVYLNGKKVTTAGVGELGVLGAHVSWVRRADEHTRSGEPGSIEEELRLHVGGLVSPAGDHLHWLDRALDVGDEVTIRIAEGGRVNRPRSRQRRDRAKELRAQKRYVRDLAKKFGWKIETR